MIQFVFLSLPLSFKKLAPSLSNLEKPGKRTGIREKVKNKDVRSSYIF